jgi:hypothetical protein
VGKPMLEPRIGYRPENPGNELIASVDSSIYRALLKDKPPIHESSIFFEVVTSKGHKLPSK